MPQFPIALPPSPSADCAGLYIASSLGFFDAADISPSFLSSPDPFAAVLSGAALLAVVPAQGVPAGLLVVGSLAPAARPEDPRLFLIAAPSALALPSSGAMRAALAALAEGCAIASSYAPEEVAAMLVGTPLGGCSAAAVAGGAVCVVAPLRGAPAAALAAAFTDELLPGAALVAMGPAGLWAPRMGLGVMSAAFYGTGDAAADEAASLAAIDAAVELCAPSPVLLDTAWIYSSPGGLHSEAIVGSAVRKHGRAAFIIATKFGSFLDAPPDSSLETMEKQYCESIARLGTAPDLYYQHRPDPKRDVVEVMKDLKRFVEDGRIKYVGLSECTAEELRRAHEVHPVTAVQMEWSLCERGVEAPQGGVESLVALARRLGVAIVCYSPLARGLLGGGLATAADVAAPVDRRRNLPRFASGAMEENVARAAALHALGERYSATPAQLALAWLLRQGPNVFPIPGTKTRARVAENFGALDLAAALREEDVKDIEALSFSQVGARYGAAGVPFTWEARAAEK